MNVSFLHNNPLETVIINSADGLPLYEVDTPSKLTNRKTTVRRGAEGGFVVVAEVEWHNWGSDKITFLGSNMRLDDFLPHSKGFMSMSRLLTGNDGRQYKWKNPPSNKLILVDVQTKNVVAESHRKKYGVFSEPRKMNLDIHAEGITNIDAIIVSFIIMEEKCRERDRASVAAAA